MATTAKNFRIKQGLVVEGTTGTINGNNILTESTAGDNYILSLVGGATLVKSVSTDFSVDGSGNLTANKANLLTSLITPTSGSSYGLVGTANYLELKTGNGYNTEIDVDIAAVESKLTTDGFALTSDITDAISTLGGQTSTDIADAITTAEGYTDSAIDALTTNDIEEGTGAGANLYFTATRAQNALSGMYDPAGSAATARTDAEDYADGLAVNYDSAGSAATALQDAKDYADALDTDDISEGSSNKYFTSQRALDATASAYDAAGTAAGLAGNYDAAGSADAAEENAKSYADTLIGDNTVNGTAGNTVKDRIATAVANLVDSAPAALDTLNELAAALGDNVDGMTGIATAIGNKLPLAGGTMSGNIAMGTNKVTGLGAPSSDNDAATKKYVDDQTTTDVAEGTNLYFTNQRALDATSAAYDPAGSAGQAEINANDYTDATVGNILDGDTSFTAINVNAVAGVYAATSTVATAGTATAWSFNAATFTTAKLLVKFATATHTQVSEILLTLDASGNVATTEYAEVGTNGSLGTVTAVNTAGTVNIRVTTAHDATDVIVYATALI